jgi:hypothetical protein
MSAIKFFSTVDENFVRQNFKDAVEAEKLIAKHRKKAVVILGIVASFVVVLLVALGYAVMKISNTKVELIIVESTQIQIDQCMTDTQQQATDAASAQARAEEVNKNTSILLEECKRNKK